MHKMILTFSLVMLALFAAACAPGTAPVQLVTAVPAATSAAEATAPAAPTNVSGDGTTRTVTDALGKPVEIPTAPQRVIAQDYLGELLAVGVTPLGTVDRFFDESDLFSEHLTGVERLGDANNPNLEKVALLKPDLILVNQYLEPDALAHLAEIAPTVPINDSADFAARLKTVAELVNKSAEAQAWLDEYAAEQARVRSQLASVIQPGEKALIVSMWQDLMWVQATRSIGQTVYNTLGFAPTDKIKADVDAIMSGANTDGQAGYLEISAELLPEYAADADRIFILVSDDADSQHAFETFQQNPLWQNLSVVKNNRVYPLSTRWGWYNPIGLQWELEASPKLLGATQ